MGAGRTFRESRASSLDARELSTPAFPHLRKVKSLRLRTSTFLSATAAAVTTIGMLPGTASASHSTYYTFPWANSELISYIVDPNVPIGDWRARLADGREEWNSVFVDSEPFFSYNGLSAVPSVDVTCTEFTQEAGIRREQLNDVQGGGEEVAGLTRRCTVSGNTIRGIMAIDTGAGPASGWYTGTGTPGATEKDLGGVFSHEFGHLGGWSGHWPEGVDCPSTNTRKTMCIEVLDGTIMQRTIGNSEVAMFTSAYPSSH